VILSHTVLDATVFEVLFSVVLRGELECVKNLYATPSANILLAAPTLFAHAAEKGHADIVEFLANFVHDKEDIQFAFRLAYTQQRQSVVDVLIPLVDPHTLRQYI